MKSSTSRSLLPSFSCSRIWRRRSTARSAFDSAIDWFWQTRQRSSAAIAATRWSRSGWLSARPRPARNGTTSSTQNNLFTGKLPDQRQDFLREDLARHRADLLVADDAALVDHVGLRHAVDAVVDADASLRVDYGEVVGIAVRGEPAQPILAPVLVVQSIDGHGARLRQLEQHRMLLPAGHAPRRPDIQQPHAAQALLRG